MKIKSLPVRFADQIFFFLIAIIVLIEEFVWKKVKALMELVAKLPLIHRIETLIAGSHRAIILVLFLVPFLVMHGFELFGLALTGMGYYKEGLLIYILSKIAGYFFIARLFVIGRDKLMTYRAFAYCYDKLMAFKEFIYGQPAWQKVKTILHGVRLKIQSWKADIFGGETGFRAKLKAMRKITKKNFGC